MFLFNRIILLKTVLFSLVLISCNGSGEKNNTDKTTPGSVPKLPASRVQLQKSYSEPFYFDKNKQLQPFLEEFELKLLFSDASDELENLFRYYYTKVEGSKPRRHAYYDPASVKKYRKKFGLQSQIKSFVPVDMQNILLKTKVKGEILLAFKKHNEQPLYKKKSLPENTSKSSKIQKNSSSGDNSLNHKSGFIKLNHFANPQKSVTVNKTNGKSVTVKKYKKKSGAARVYSKKPVISVYPDKSKEINFDVLSHLAKEDGYLLFRVKNKKEFAENLKKGVLGEFKSEKWGGVFLSNHKTKQEVFLYQKGNLCLLSYNLDNIQYYHAALGKYLDSKDKKTFFGINSTKITTVIKPYLELVNRKIGKLNILFRQYNIFISAKKGEIAFKSLDHDVYEIICDLFSDSVEKLNSHGEKIKTLPKYVPEESSGFIVDKTNWDPFVNKTKKFYKLMKRVKASGSLDKKKQATLDILIEILNDSYGILKTWNGSTVFSVHEIANENLAGGILGVKNKQKPAKLIENLKNFFTHINPVRLKKKLKGINSVWQNRISNSLIIKTKKLKYKGKKGFLLSLNFKKTKKKSTDLYHLIINQVIGNNIKIAFLPGKNEVLFAIGKNWKKEMKRLWNPGKSLKLHSIFALHKHSSHATGINIYKLGKQISPLLKSNKKLKNNEKVKNLVSKLEVMKYGKKKKMWAIFNASVPEKNGQEAKLKMSLKFSRRFSFLSRY